MYFSSGFSRKPLVHAHMQEIASAIYNKIEIIPKDEFWHLPRRSITENNSDTGTLDWVLVHRIKKGRNNGHIPIVGIQYDSTLTTKLDLSENPRQNPLCLTVGPHDTATDVANYVHKIVRRKHSQQQPAKYLDTAGYQLRLQKALGQHNVVGLQEVALSDVGGISDKLDKRIRAEMKEGNISSKYLPGDLRFDLLVATPPPMCFALVAIEIDGRHHDGNNDFNDRLKNAYCKVTGLPLIRIGIGKGRGLTDQHNKVHDELLENYTRWIADAVNNTENELQHISLLLDSISSVAHGANQGVKSDLFALAKHSRKSIKKLDSFVNKGISEAWNTEANPGDPDSSDYEKLTTIKIDGERDRGDLYLKISPRWLKPTTLGYYDQKLPDGTIVGPIRMKVIAPKEFEEDFTDSIYNDFKSIYRDGFEKKTKQNLNLDGNDDYDYILEKLVLCSRIASNLNDSDTLEIIVTDYLGEPPPEKWDKVKVGFFNQSEIIASLPSGFESIIEFGEYSPASTEYCLKYWTGVKNSFNKKKDALHAILEDLSIKTPEESHELILLLVEERQSIWDTFDVWKKKVNTAIRISPRT